MHFSLTASAALAFAFLCAGSTVVHAQTLPALAGTVTSAEAAGSGHKVLDGTGDVRLVGVGQRGSTCSDVDRHARDIVGQRNESPPRTLTGSLGPAVAQSLYARLRFPRYAIIAGPMIPLHGRSLIAAPVPFSGY